MDKLSKLTNILMREDFVDGAELKEQNKDIEPLKKDSALIDVKPLSEKERVKKFDEYIADPKTISAK